MPGPALFVRTEALKKRLPSFHLGSKSKAFWQCLRCLEVHLHVEMLKGLGRRGMAGDLGLRRPLRAGRQAGRGTFQLRFWALLALLPAGPPNHQLILLHQGLMPGSQRRFRRRPSSKETDKHSHGRAAWPSSTARPPGELKGLKKTARPFLTAAMSPGLPGAQRGEAQAGQP